MFMYDSNFIINYTVKNEPHHKLAFGIHNLIKNKCPEYKIIIPSIVYNETITTLFTKTTNIEKIRKICSNFQESKNVINFPINEISTFGLLKTLSDEGYFKNALNSHRKMRTSDTLIACSAKQLNAYLLSFDIPFYDQLSTVYDKIYDCTKTSEIKRLLTNIS